ncbi:MAG: 30S ribosomal protein S17 [Candidatus Dojkabacteria bacterium]
MADNKNNKRKLEGEVVSNKMQNGIVVRVTRWFPHPKYGKIISKSKKYYAKTEDEISVGSRVVIEETRPVSKLIRWKVVEVKTS